MSAMSEAATRNRAGYDEDFAAWAEEQARLIFAPAISLPSISSMWRRRLRG